MTQIWQAFVHLVQSEDCWAGYLLPIGIWLHYRLRRYVRELSARQQQRELHLVNVTWKTAFETVLREQPRRLRDLVDDTDNESSLKP